MTLAELRTAYDKRVWGKEAIERRIASLRTNIADDSLKLEAQQKAAVIIQTAARQTQEQLEYHIAELVTLALETVFPGTYKFKMLFELKRKQTEITLLFEDSEGNQIDPLEASGYGPVDVAAFALRIAFWSLQKKRTRPTFLFDEPFRFVSMDRRPALGELLQDLKERMGLQFIIVSHCTVLPDYADRIFTVTKKGNKSEVSR